MVLFLCLPFNQLGTCHAQDSVEAIAVSSNLQVIALQDKAVNLICREGETEAHNISAEVTAHIENKKLISFSDLGKMFNRFLLIPVSGTVH